MSLRPRAVVAKLDDPERSRDTNDRASDLFTDGVEGFIVPIRDPDALLDRMQRLAADPALQQRMSEAALLRVRSFGGWQKFGDQWENLLRRLTNAS